MPKVTVTVAHAVDPAIMVERTGAVIEKTVKDFQGQDLQLDWSQQTARFKFTSLGFAIDGNVKIDDKQVTVEVDLPMAAMMFKDRVHEAVTKNLRQAIEGSA
jgi:hypothetical protein